MYRQSLQGTAWCVIALGDVLLLKEMIMTHTRYAFIQARWHFEIVSQALIGFHQKIPAEQVDTFEVPGAFEMPLLARELAATKRYAAVAAAAFVVDGGIYRHDFVASTVIDGLMQVQLETDVPVISAVLTPHQFQETGPHIAFFQEHFVTKGKEAADAVMMITGTFARLAAA